MHIPPVSSEALFVLRDFSTFSTLRDLSTLGDLPGLAFPMPAMAFSELSWTVLAQTGTTKTIIGWVLVLLCLALALLVVGRPNAREPHRRRW